MPVKRMIFFCLLLFFIFLPIKSNASVIHVVQNGQSLWQISKQYGYSVDQIRKLNGIGNINTIIPGESLLIPGQTYIVQPSENLSDISNRHSITTAQLSSVNKLKSTVIKPNQKLTIPKSPKKHVFAGTFLEHKSPSSDKWLLENYKDLLTGVGFFELHPDINGNLSSFPNKKAISTAWVNHITPYVTIANLTSKGFDYDLVHTLISVPEKRKKLIQNIFQLLHENDLKGVIIDFERLKPEDRTHYNIFIKELGQRLHPVGMEIAVAVPPMQGDKTPSYYAGYDYKTLGQHADFLFLMTYDWHWFGGPAGPIAPIQEVKTVVDYAVKAIPPSKVMLGIPMYAYDWVINKPNQKGISYSQEQAVEISRKYGSVIHYDKNTAQPSFRYTDSKGLQHVVWFEDARSILAKYRLVKQYQLGGIGAWKLGLSFPQAERLLLEEFDIQKEK
ncbi:glycosyl hydrolase family 18 protein [Metabacillus fastidiosus]|uniref:glycosyl hydrolase family 18 protein n=1 Tax=Metabacillus fastidiosus TaxID=1458 RepID=UPI003D2E5BC8